MLQAGTFSHGGISESTQRCTGLHVPYGLDFQMQAEDIVGGTQQAFGTRSQIVGQAE